MPTNIAMLFALAAITASANGLPINNKPPPDELKPCGSSPNCVSSIGEGDGYIKPLQLPVQKNGELMLLLKRVVEKAGCSSMKMYNGYLRAEFKSMIFRFTDDLEMLVKEDRIEVRSAARSGYYDFGVNRKRVEKIRALLKEEGS